MPNLTTAEYNAILARRQAGKPTFTSSTDSRQSEADLHAQILDECRQRMWIAFHGSMAHSTFRTPGEPDFIILTENKVWLIECKTAVGKLSTDQRAIAAWAAKLGHTVHVIRSFEDFLHLTTV